MQSAHIPCRGQDICPVTLNAIDRSALRCYTQPGELPVCEKATAWAELEVRETYSSRHPEQLPAAYNALPGYASLNCCPDPACFLASKMNCTIRLNSQKGNLILIQESLTGTYLLPVDSSGAATYSFQLCCKHLLLFFLSPPPYISEA